MSEIHLGLPVLWKSSLFIRLIHSVTNQKTQTCPLHLFRPPAAPTPLSEKGRIRFPEAVALTNQKQCFLPQWYPKFHQEHWNLPFFCCNFHFTSALPDTPVKVSPNVASYQLLKTANAANVWNLLMSQPCMGLQPTKAWLEFQDAQWQHLVWLRAEPPEDSGEIRQRKPHPRGIWRRHLRSPYSLLPNLQWETPSSPLILSQRTIYLGNCSFHPPYSLSLMREISPEPRSREKIFYLL